MRMGDDTRKPRGEALMKSVARLASLHGPVLLINGHERDFLMASSKATFDAIDKLPTFYGARHGAGHKATVDHPGGGEWANVASNWLMWQLKGDKAASKMFVGKDCSLCKKSELGHRGQAVGVSGQRNSRGLGELAGRVRRAPSQAATAGPVLSKVPRLARPASAGQ
jgi:hypothetical protein